MLLISIPSAKKFESENVRIFIGSQEDKNFLQDLRSLIPHVDVLIDDGGHTMKQQVTTFEAYLIMSARMAFIYVKTRIPPTGSILEAGIKRNAHLSNIAKILSTRSMPGTGKIPNQTT